MGGEGNTLNTPEIYQQLDGVIGQQVSKEGVGVGHFCNDLL